MSPLPKSLFWTRIDTSGADHVLVDDRRGLTARGTVLAATDPIPYVCRYGLATDDGWEAVRLEVEVEGAGWLRTLRMERAAGRWRVTTAEQGDLDAALAAAGQPPVGLPGIEEPDRLDDALDVDLNASVLFNTLPIRRLRLHQASPGDGRSIVAAWVLVPSLQVAPAEQVYTGLGGGKIRFESTGFGADITVDADGYVLHYPGLAERAGRNG